MSRPFKIEIAESEEELKKRLQTVNLGNQKEKLIMLWWIKIGQVKEQQEIGKLMFQYPLFRPYYVMPKKQIK
ncbi:hypothetical protein IQ277_09690 [Nostocales cyanobacterium LEGE 12452]|nr:hypothetical protein [Nostocales cyanobacterium LEGE 12452]